MVLDWVLLVIGVVGSVYVLLNARRLASRPPGGTGLRPSYRAWLVVALALGLIAVGALINLFGAE